MKILTRSIRDEDKRSLEDRGHAVIEIGPSSPETTAETMNRIAAANAVLMDSYDMDSGIKENFLLGLAVALGKDVVFITNGIEDYWDEVPTLRRFATFDDFLDKVEEGRL